MDLCPSSAGDSGAGGSAAGSPRGDASSPLHFLPAPAAILASARSAAACSCRLTLLPSLPSLSFSLTHTHSHFSQKMAPVPTSSTSNLPAEAERFRDDFHANEQRLRTIVKAFREEFGRGAGLVSAPSSEQGPGTASSRLTPCHAPLRSQAWLPTARTSP
jgi:hypothetical protein